MKTINIYNYLFYVLTLMCMLMLWGCEDFLETDEPSGQIKDVTIFENEASATAAITTLYAKLRDDVLLTGTSQGLGAQMGMYTDELNFYASPGYTLEAFYQHQLLASNPSVLKIWNSSYNLIYLANAAIEGIENSDLLSASVKNQLIGEAMFVRGMIHFYLVNLFDAIPYITTTSYQDNKSVSRMSVNEVYVHIVEDLQAAKELLGENYLTNERTRANRYVVSALLARVYLYMEEWEKAELESSLLIDNTALFNISSSLTEEFLISNPSGILRLKTKMAGYSPNESSTFVFVSGPPSVMSLREDFVASMEEGDLRRTHWVGIVTNGTTTWYHSHKYKQNNPAQYSVIFRLPEQYLIRAEARTHLGKFLEAKQDLNKIRHRAGLDDTTANSSDELLEAIVQERRFELFVEHGHRWFDLRRLGKATEVLAPIKPNWDAKNINLPIPETELSMNPNLLPQNLGY